MSLVVKLEDDLGERSDWIMLHGVIPSREERDFPCLRCIDQYGKTVFNHLQPLLGRHQSRHTELRHYRL